MLKSVNRIADQNEMVTFLGEQLRADCGENNLKINLIFKISSTKFKWVDLI